MKVNKKKKLVNNEKLILKKPKNNFILNFYKNFVSIMLNLFFLNKKSASIARRILFEIEWRVNKSNTYSLRGWCNRIFNYN